MKAGLKESMLKDSSTPIYDIQKQAASDIAKRSLTGCFIYLFCWAIIVLPTGFYKQHPFFVFHFTVILSVLGLSRYAVIRKFEQVYSYSPMLWSVMINSNIIISALTWGILFPISIVDQTFSSISLIIMVSLAGMTGGGATSLSPDFKLAAAMLLAYLLPSIVTISFIHDEFDISLCLLFITFLTGMVGVTYSQNKEYWKSMDSSVLIMNYASELEKLNTLDGLTGLRNRKYFDEELTKEIQRAERRGTELSLLMMDIDHFKNVNDTYGHLAGDKCLQTAAGIFGEIVKRETDTIVRYGGEEFAIILPELSQQQALQFAEKIREKFENTKIIWNGLPITLTLSIGTSTVQPKGNFKYELLIKSADEALYKAKEEGRNRVISKTLLCERFKSF